MSTAHSSEKAHIQTALQCIQRVTRWSENTVNEPEVIEYLSDAVTDVRQRLATCDGHWPQKTTSAAKHVEPEWCRMCREAYPTQACAAMHS